MLSRAPFPSFSAIQQFSVRQVFGFRTLRIIRLSIRTIISRVCGWRSARCPLLSLWGWGFGVITIHDGLWLCQPQHLCAVATLYHTVYNLYVPLHKIWPFVGFTRIYLGGMLSLAIRTMTPHTLLVCTPETLPSNSDALPDFVSRFPRAGHSTRERPLSKPFAPPSIALSKSSYIDLCSSGKRISFRPY